MTHIERVFRKQSVLLGLVLAFISPSVFASPQYASEETKRVIENMLEAHGGMDKWQSAPSIQYDAVMHNNYHGKNESAWWVQHEVIDQGTRQVYQNWPLDDAQLGFDGKEVWSQNWERSNPPSMMVHFFYYFVNLPWLTQDEGVVLGEPAKFKSMYGSAARVCGSSSPMRTPVRLLRSHDD